MRPKNFVQLHQYKNNEIVNKKLIKGLNLNLNKVKTNHVNGNAKLSNVLLTEPQYISEPILNNQNQQRANSQNSDGHYNFRSINFGKINYEYPKYSIRTSKNYKEDMKLIQKMV